MTSLKLFNLKRSLRNRDRRKGYHISTREHQHCITFQIDIYLKNCDSYKEAERNAKLAIRAIRNKLGSIV